VAVRVSGITGITCMNLPDSIRRLFRRLLPERSTPEPTCEQLGARVEPEVDYFALAKWLISTAQPHEMRPPG